LVTSGGTREKIDEVRSITNSSSGELGSLICDRLADLADCEKVFYVCGEGAMLPQNDKAEIIQVSSAGSALDAVKYILLNNNIGAVIHAMAVSDYRVKSIQVANGLELDCGRKINSSEKQLILVLESAPKIIPVFSELAPDALLVGFKLLYNVTREELIDEAYNILQKNSCSFVIANDKKFITKTKHRAYLVDKNKDYIEFETKNEIADGIVNKLESMLRKR
jgi:phosphopantothenate-cysteine ligase